MERWPNSEECNQTVSLECGSLLSSNHIQGFSLANNSDKGMYDILAEYPDRAQRFGMYFSKADESSDMLLNNYPWANHKTVVDVGGSHGSMAISIAERFPGVTCIVQDLPVTIAEGKLRLPTHLKTRVVFMAQSVTCTQKSVCYDDLTYSAVTSSLSSL